MTPFIVSASKSSVSSVMSAIIAPTVSGLGIVCRHLDAGCVLCIGLWC